jgi:hypothetical protein
MMLLTFFMSEYFFATGLELRGMTTFKDAQQARMLARSVFKAVQIGLLQDEVEFFKGYEQVAGLLTIGAVPWNQGLLLTLEIAPQDHLFNLNNSAGLQPGSDTDICRYNVFRQSIDEILKAHEQAAPGQDNLEVVDPASLYAAIFDWTDSDDELYVAVPGFPGAEADSYYASQPEYTIKNGQLDRLEELRLLRGFRTSGLTWGDWEQHYSALAKSKEGNYCNFSEKLNVNLVDEATIISFLKVRYLDSNLLSGEANKPIQAAINEFVDSADTIAQAFAPEGEARRTYNMAKIKETLRDIGLNENSAATNILFSTVNEYYRIRAVTEVAGVRARLEAMLYVPRDPANRLAKGVPKVLWETVN